MYSKIVVDSTKDMSREVEAIKAHLDDLINNQGYSPNSNAVYTEKLKLFFKGEGPYPQKMSRR